MPMNRLFALLFFAMTAAMVQAQYVMYDFEQPWQFEDWSVSQPGAQHVTRVSRFGTQGSTAVHLDALASSQASEFKLRLWDNNYEPYDRIAFDITNASVDEVRLVVGLIGDIDNGYRFHVTVPPLTHKTIVHKIKLPKFIRHDNIHFMTFTAEPGMAVDVYIDNIVALRKDEKASEIESEKLAKEIAELRKRKVMAMINQTRGALHAQDFDLPKARAMLLDELQELEKQANEMEFSQGATLALVDDIRKLGQTADRFEEIASYLKEYDKPTDAGFLVGFADSMRKIMPRHLRTHLDIEDAVELSLAGGEKEAFQVAVVPFNRAAQNVTVEMSDLKGPDGATINKDAIDTDLMAYTKTAMRTTPGVEYIGWWPDPIIDTDEAVDVALGDVQSWWVRINASRDQEPGVYTGTLTVKADGQDDLVFSVTAEVYGFNVPRHAPIPTAVTYLNRNMLEFPPIGSKEKWEEVKFDHTDVLNDYYINIDSIYNWANPDRFDAVDWELMEYQREKGTLVSFNLSHFNDAKDKLIESIQPYYEEAKKRGMLKHAYIYGFDETPPYSWQSIEDATKKLNEEFPEVMTMVTSQDHSYGFNSPIKHLGAWCPIISRYNPTLAEQAREKGRKVWWYTCIWPPHPYPNVFVDYPAIDNRVLTGLMHMKYQPDGFLYYATSIWRSVEGLSKYPYSDWNPNSYGNTNGDGSYFVLGADGSLIPTIRIENYRDGFEDLAYYMILEHQVKTYEKSNSHVDDAWLRKAKDALAQIDQYVRSRTDWPKDPEQIYNYRAELAKLIEASPIKDTDPWKNGMGVRGLPRN